MRPDRTRRRRARKVVPVTTSGLKGRLRRVRRCVPLRTCRSLARRGFLFGGWTGTVVSGARDWLARHQDPGLTAVDIARDLGERAPLRSFGRTAGAVIRWREAAVRGQAGAGPGDEGGTRA